MAAITGQPKIAEIGNDKFDYALLGEIMEHIGNPVYFLKSFLSNYRENTGQVMDLKRLHQELN
jgi:hypothetical protein